MADKTIRENFFDAKAIGSLWDVAVSLKRGNPLPIDADSVFESEAKLIEYIGDKITTVAYPGQVVAVVNSDSTQIFYIDQELNYHPVGAKLDADGESIKVDNNVLKLVGFDEAADGLLAQVKVDAEGNRTLNWVSIETIAQGDGNTTYTFTGLDKESNVYFEVKASDVETATKIYLDTYTTKQIDDKLSELDKKVTDAGYQNATQVNTAISTALVNYYNKTAIDETVEDLESKISAIPKFTIEVVSAKEDGKPDVATPSTTTVYLIPDNDTITSDVYDEYIYVNGNWELLGKQTLDLTNYATKDFVAEAIEDHEYSIAPEVTLTFADLANEVGVLQGDATTAGSIAKSIDDAIKDHNDTKPHLSSSDVDNQIDSKLTSADYEGKIATAKQEAIAAIPVKTVDENEFTLATDGKLSVKEIAQTKVAGLAEAFNAVNKSISDLDAYVGDIPSDDKYADITNVIAYINKKAEETLAAANGGSSESAASVAQALETYKSENDPKVKKNTEDIASIFEKLNTVEENAQENIIESIKINGVAVEVTDKSVNIPAATADKFGTVKLGAEFQINSESEALEVKALNVNKLVQTENEVLVLDGGVASDLISE